VSAHDAVSKGKFEVVIAGGSVAALEAALALADLAPERTNVKVLAPDSEFTYRPLAVRAPFSYGRLDTYPLRPIVQDAGGELVADRLARVDAGARVAHTHEGRELPYDALLVATGALARARYEHALTIDDRHLDEILHGLIQDIEGGYVQRLAFVIPARMAWPLPVYELALMSSGRAYDMGAKLDVTIVTPEDRPLAIFGAAVSEALEGLLTRAQIETITAAYAEIPAAGEIVINPGDRRVSAERIVALPELYGRPTRGLPAGEHGFLPVDPHARVLGVDRVYAAGDGTEFPIKFGGLAAQQADAAAESIAAEAGVPLTPQPYTPVLEGMLLTDSKPLYLSARITGGHGFSSEISETPSEPEPAKIAARYLAPYLHAHDVQPA
jgi:sulfide:quinone oxidoreductase